MYLQLIEGTVRRENRQQEVSEISRAIEEISQELKFQLWRFLNYHEGWNNAKINVQFLSDIRESGSIEQDADMLHFSNRDDYYQHVKVTKRMAVKSRKTIMSLK